MSCNSIWILSLWADGGIAPWLIGGLMLGLTPGLLLCCLSSRSNATILQKAIRNMSESCVLVDAEGKDMPIIYCNPSFCELTGYEPHEVVGRNCRFLQGPNTSRKTTSAIRNAIDKGLPFTGELLNYKKDGTVIWNLLRITPIHNAQGKVTHFMGLQTDITQQKLNQEKFDENLLGMSKIHSLGVLSSAYAHELSQPVASSLRNAQAARRFLSAPDVDLEEMNDTIAEIIDAQERAASIIEGIRSQAKMKHFICNILDLNEVLAGTLELIPRSAIGLNGIQLNLHPEPLWIKGDLVQLQQVFMNLINNAIEASALSTTTGSIVAKTWINDQGQPCAAITDCGPGIDPNTLSDIFEPFVTSKNDGLGIGLSICKSIIQSHRGTIEASNNKNSGARFVIQLPPGEKPNPS